MASETAQEIHEAGKVAGAETAATTHAEVGQGGGAGMPQLDPETYASQLFWLTVSFILLYLLISKSALPRIQRTLKTRQDRIADDLDRAEALAQQADTARAAYEKSETDARTKAQAMLQEAVQRNEQMAKGEFAQLDETLQNKLAEADAALSAQVARAEGELASVTKTVTGQIVEKILGVASSAASAKKVKAS